MSTVRPKKLLHRIPILIIGVFLLIVISFLITGHYLQKQLIAIYEHQNSLIIQDRNGQEIKVLANPKGNFARYLDKIPPQLEKLLIEKEDQQFYWHLGFNPWTTFQASLGYFGFGPKKPSSTITQQLVKILLGKELKRNLKNKIIESFYAISLETFQSKEKILKMYINSVYFGNQAQGLTEASRLYFNLSPDLLTNEQILQLLATIPSPTKNNPAKSGDTSSEVKENIQRHFRSSNAYFEIQNLSLSLENNQLTLDKSLTEKIRMILRQNIEDLESKNVKNGAAIVIKLPENEILTLIGSPDPDSFEKGYQINMLKEPRAIGSTIKPFIYLKAFEKGLRPYTLANDREYKYITAIGFPIYPKNFDYKYRGEVTLHYALSNSLNVPAVKVLEYVGLENFYNFLEQDLKFKPIQDLDNYQLGIALGTLEMNLLNLAEYFTIFPNQGVLKNLKIFKNAQNFEKQISESEYIQLVNKILNDRKTGIEQFGLKSDINLFQKNYALKTGTSRDFRDSWIIGYTPDFLVGVWLGNSDNTPTKGISGQIGAGRTWAKIMELLLNSEYNKKTPFDFDLIKEFNINEKVEYGLANDNYQKCQNILKEKDSSLILNPHNGDTFLFEKNTKIILKAEKNVNWFVNEKFLGQGENYIFSPAKPGQYQITAEALDGFRETINIQVNE